MADWETLKFAFTITLIGTSIVFLSLIVLCVLMSLFPLLNYEWKKPSDTDKGGSDDSSYLEIEEDDDFHNDSSDNSSNSSLIALLTAAATAYMGSSSDVKVRVTSFKRIPQTSPVWNTVGRSEYISNKL